MPGTNYQVRGARYFVIPKIKELNINPLVVLEGGKGCFDADAKFCGN